jgi:hypothetical protein
MEFMPVANPMLCQSFGARAGLVGKLEERRPNSRNSDQGDDDEAYSHGPIEGFFASDMRAVQEGPYPRDSPRKRSRSPPRMLDTVPQSWSLDINQNDEDAEEVYVNNDDGFGAPFKNALPSIAHAQSQLNPDSFRSQLEVPQTLEDLESGRSCHIMNDLRVSNVAVPQTRSSPSLEAQASNLNQMDYLLGIADIIDSYEEEPPTLKKSGAATSRAKTATKTALKSAVGKSRLKDFAAVAQ